MGDQKTTSQNLRMSIPIQGQTTTPYFENYLIQALNKIDSHDHSSGKGLRITQSSLSITDNFSFNDFGITKVYSLAFSNPISLNPLKTPAAASVYFLNGEFYIKDGSSNVIQLTSGGGLNTSALGTISGNMAGSGASVTYYDLQGRFVFFTDTGAGTEELSIVKVGSLEIGGTVSGDYLYTAGFDVPTLSASYTQTLPNANPVANSFIRISTVGVWSYLATIPDSMLDVISTSGKVANSATSALSTNTAHTIVLRDATGNFSAGMITGNLTGAVTGNASTATTLQNARTINGVSFNGSANIVVTSNTTETLTRGSFLTGSNFNGSSSTTWAVDATDANTASKVVARDASGNFSAGTITAALVGNASTATTLQTARTIAGTSFDGSANIGIAHNNTTGLNDDNYKHLTASEKGVFDAVSNWNATDLAKAFNLIQKDATGATTSALQTSGVKLPTGTTAERPTGVTGITRVNTTLGKVEFYDGSGWKVLDSSSTGGLTLDDLTDVDVAGVTDGQVLSYEDSSGNWVPTSISTTLAGLTDTTIATPTEGQILQYNATSEKWENEDLPSSLELIEVTTTSTVTPTAETRYVCKNTSDIVLTIDASGCADGVQIEVYNASSFAVSTNDQLLSAKGSFVLFGVESGELVFKSIKTAYEAYLAVPHSNSPYISVYGKDYDIHNKLSNPSTLPVGTGYDVSFSTDGLYMAVAHAGTPYISIYKRGGDTFTKLANPTDLPPSEAYACAFSADGTYLAVGHDDNPRITIYKRSGDTFTKLANPTALPGNDGQGVAFSVDGVYMAVAVASSPFITIYKRSGDTFTKLADPSVLPASSSYSVAFSADGVYMAVGHVNTPFVTIYKRSGDIFTKLANPSNLPTGTGSGVAFSADGLYMAVAHTSSPFITIYKRSGDTFTKLANPSVLPANYGTGVAFSVDGLYMAVAHGGSPFITIYKRSGDTFTKLADPSDLPTIEGGGVAFYPPAVPGSR